MMPVALRAVFTEADFGGKAVKLGESLRAGLPVPPGFALPVDLTRAVAAGDAPSIATVTALDLERPFAVRSSAVGEDSEGASFAGQHVTALNVRGPAAVVAAIRSVHESATTEAALHYRRRQGVAGPPRMAVVLQPMLDGERAGVLFTVNPMDGRRERVIEASWGLGEAVVSGLVTPDFYRLSESGRELERRVAVKDRALRLGRDGGVEEYAVDEPRARAATLSGAELERLHDLAARCQARFGPALDLEWLFVGEDLYLLQVRVITTLGARKVA